MNTVKVRNVEIGGGMPSICVPIVGETIEEIMEEARNVCALKADIAEWRADWFRDLITDTNGCREDASAYGSAAGVTERGVSAYAPYHDAVREVLAGLRDVLGDVPLLVTIRTAAEGGEADIPDELYEDIITYMVQSGYADMIDIEVIRAGDEDALRMTGTAHAAGVPVVGSSHDFAGTPDKEEIVSRLVRMQELGADICKIAVMPQNRRDVLTLLEATEEMYTEHADRPIVTMSMSAAGAVSRIAGETFGSAITFGSASKASAPGQIGAADLRYILTVLHEQNMHEA